MSDFGAGPFLTQDFDFEVTNTGDIRAADGIEELQKDIAMQATIQLDDILGATMTTNAEARLTAGIRRIMNNEPRIDAISNISVRFNHSQDTAEVVANVVADGSDQELVFQL